MVFNLLRSLLGFTNGNLLHKEKSQIEEAERENDEAFAEMKQVYNEYPERAERMRRAVESVNTPFADLESMMREEGRRRRRGHSNGRRLR